jgi:hypothetical protein
MILHCTVEEITTDPDPATLDRLWQHTYDHLDHSQSLSHTFLYHRTRSARLQHTRQTLQHWQRQPLGFLVEIQINDYPTMWFAGQQQNQHLICYLALISPDAHNSRRWMLNPTVYTTVRDDWILTRRGATTLRVHTVPETPPNRLIRLMRQQFDRQWGIQHHVHPPQTQTAAHYPNDDPTQPLHQFNYTWQDLDWQFTR